MCDPAIGYVQLRGDLLGIDAGSDLCRETQCKTNRAEDLQCVQLVSDADSGASSESEERGPGVSADVSASDGPTWAFILKRFNQVN